MDVAHAETVEKELEAFIERRSRKEPDSDELEARGLRSAGAA